MNREADKKAWLYTEKSAPCMDCGMKFTSACMQFDHVPSRGEKMFMVNLAACKKRFSLEELIEERRKCDLVCATCHHRRTWERKNLGTAPWLPADHDDTLVCDGCGHMHCECCPGWNDLVPYRTDGMRVLCAPCYKEPT